MKIKKSSFQVLSTNLFISLILFCNITFAGNARPSGPGMGVGDSLFPEQQSAPSLNHQTQKSHTVVTPTSAEPSFDCGKVMSNIQNQASSAPAPIGNDLTVVCSTMEVMDKIANKILNGSGPGKVTERDVDNAIELFSSEIEKQFPESYAFGARHPLLKILISEAFAVRSGEPPCDGANCRKTFFRNLSEGLKKFFRGLIGMSKATDNNNLYNIMNGKKVTVDAEAIGNIVGTGLSYVCPAVRGVRTGFAFINFIQEYRRRGNVTFRSASVEYETRGQNLCCSTND